MGKFQDALGNNGNTPMPFANMQDMVQQFNACRSNPAQFLASRGINVPQQYANNPQAMAQYLLSQTPQVQQSKIYSTANMIKSILGFK